MKRSEKIQFGGIDLSRVRGLLFDVDGTLSDTDDLMVERVRAFLSPVSWIFKGKDPASFARWLVMASETPANFFYNLADRLGVDEPLMKFYERLSQKHQDEDSTQTQYLLISGVREMISNLAEKFPLGIVSARDAETTADFLDHFDLKPFFKVIVTSQTCKHTKPYAEPIIYAAEKLELTPGECVMVGDTIVDIQAGKSAGAQTIAVLCGFGTLRELRRAGADLILDSTTELVALFSD